MVARLSNGRLLFCRDALPTCNRSWNAIIAIRLLPGSTTRLLRLGQHFDMGLGKGSLGFLYSIS